ncbi:TMV resistance protein N [Arachis duranensis]|uniref:ADP-ribosyl cyclase/cyclic ADP-ribose hydrolase n=1 Tax=Arachis duranensis TaxID=130453 RepID=A0A6P5NAN2_ARADU|nr:TMV resistance protein N [Arachis duranensis]XP_020993161.1 TMV resistance protein N [Arachis duranensis]
MANPVEEIETGSETISNSSSSYDVFLSFKGEDTRYAFTGHLYYALCRKGIKTFMDSEDLRVGETTRPQLFQAIEESKVSIVVFSENYADSTWCLDELAKILECQGEKGQLVFPIFYKIEPSDVRHQRNSYRLAMAAHENKFGCYSEKVQKWKSALLGVSNITGYHLKEGFEFKFIQDIVCKAATKISPKQIPLEENVVGLQFRVAELKSLLDIESNKNTFMLGIIGTGGIGKTTLAKVFYNSICNEFEGACFISNVRKASNQDKGRIFLQQKILSDALGVQKIKLDSVEKGIHTIKANLSTKRVLIVLDDVDKIEQLKELAGGCDWFGLGSRIIVTTRDKHLLVAHQIRRIYEMEMMNDRESLELFCQNAFKMSTPARNYEDLSNRAIRYGKGLPLALKVIGSELIGKDLQVWESSLDKYEKNPHGDIQNILRISYDSLERNEKEIFLDIACFFNGQRLKYVKRILDGCDFYTDSGIKILVDKSLITIENGYLRMHDLTQDMGREIVKQEAPKESGERSRLWLCKDVLEVLTENRENSKTEGMKLDCYGEVNCCDDTLEKMMKLRVLIVHNASFSSKRIRLPNTLRLVDWKGYPSTSFPAAGFNPSKIAAFNLTCSSLVLKKPFQKFDQLTYMNFSYCQSITQFPSVSGAPNLRDLVLDGCKQLVKIHNSVGFLSKLVYLSASDCTQLRSFLPEIFLPSLEYLSFDLCKRLTHLPRLRENMDKLLKISVIHTAIRELPLSFASSLCGLEYLDMTNCKQLQCVFTGWFPKLRTLKIGGCSQLRKSLNVDTFFLLEYRLMSLHLSNASLSDDDLEKIMQMFPYLKDLIVSSNCFEKIPFKHSFFWTSLDVSYCLSLKYVLALPSSIQKVYARHCNSLRTYSSSTLWSQMRKEIKGLQIVMPKTQLPKWLDYCDSGGIPFLWARGRFPVMALVLEFGKMDYQDISLHLFIDDEHIYSQRPQRHSFALAEDHVLLCDLRLLFSDEEWKRLDVRLGHDNDWKAVQVKCEAGLNLRQWGVYVYKNETNMDDIQFPCPYYHEEEEEKSFLEAVTTSPSDEMEEETLAAVSSRKEEWSSPELSDDDSNHDNRSPGTCSLCCSALLSSFKKRLCCCKVRRARSISWWIVLWNQWRRRQRRLREEERNWEEERKMERDMRRQKESMANEAMQRDMEELLENIMVEEDQLKKERSETCESQREGRERGQIEEKEDMEEEESKRWRDRRQTIEETWIEERQQKAEKETCLSQREDIKMEEIEEVENVEEDKSKRWREGKQKMEETWIEERRQKEVVEETWMGEFDWSVMKMEVETKRRREKMREKEEEWREKQLDVTRAISSHHAPFSPNLQIVVQNLKRLITVGEDSGLDNNHDYSSEWFPDRTILRHHDGEVEG